MPITIRSSRRPRGGLEKSSRSRRRGGRVWLALMLAMSIACAGCSGRSRSGSDELFVLQPESAANKAMQTRQFETPSSDELLSASAAVLQDLGFQITESDRSLGFLRAAKERSAREHGQEIGRDIIVFLTLVLSVFARGNATFVMPVDLHQQINASLIASPPQGDDRRQEIRVVFYRLVWRGSGRSGNQSIPPGEQKMEMLRDAEIYQQFFSRLSKAVFLEAQKI